VRGALENSRSEFSRGESREERARALGALWKERSVLGAPSAPRKAQSGIL